MAMTKEELKEWNQKDSNVKARKKYQKDKTVMISIQLVKNTESDLIDFLNTKSNRSGYIKSLIGADMENQKNT